MSWILADNYDDNYGQNCSDSDDEDCWVEKDVMLSVAERRAKEVSFQNVSQFSLHICLFKDESEEEQMIGPQIPQKVKFTLLLSFFTFNERFF